MAFPKIVILARGGTHGDFLYQACQIMTNSKEVKKIKDNGMVKESSQFKKHNSRLYRKGKFTDLMANCLDHARPIEVCHTWFEEFKNWPSNFYYIDYDDHHIPIILEMFLEKVFNNDLSLVLEEHFQSIPDALAKKIHRGNVEKILTMSYKTEKNKYKKQPNIKAIQMKDLYDYKKLVGVLKQMSIYDVKYLAELQNFHSLWIERNDKWIQRIIKTKQ